MELAEIRRRLTEAHGARVRLCEETFVGFKARARFVDTEYGEWFAPVYAVCRGTRHPQRAKDQAKVSLEEIHTRFDETLGIGLIRIKPESYRGIVTKCAMIDAKFGEFSALPQNVLNGLGHPQRWADTRRERTRKPTKEIEERVLVASGGKVRLIGPYTGMLNKCRFLDEDYGEFDAYPGNVIHQGTRHTYGAGARRRATQVELHWKTNAKLVCTASYELAVVQWWNHTRTDFLWQHKTFRMPDGRTYRPDAYLPDRNLWIEIKGYFWQRSEGKWAWFHQENPNSELWDERHLKELGIRVRG